MMEYWNKERRKRKERRETDMETERQRKRETKRVTWQRFIKFKIASKHRALKSRKVSLDSLLNITIFVLYYDWGLINHDRVYFMVSRFLSVQEPRNAPQITPSFNSIQETIWGLDIKWLSLSRDRDSWQAMMVGLIEGMEYEHTENMVTVKTQCLDHSCQWYVSGDWLGAVFEIGFSGDI